MFSTYQYISYLHFRQQTFSTPLTFVINDNYCIYFLFISSIAFFISQNYETNCAFFTNLFCIYKTTML